MTRSAQGARAAGRSELGSSFALRALTAVGGVGATLLTTVVAVRQLDPREAAAFLAVLAGLMLGPMIGKMGLGQNVIRLVAAHGQGDHRRAVIGAHLRISALLAVASAPVIAVLSTASVAGSASHGTVLVLVTVLLVAETLRLMLSDVFAAVGDLAGSVAGTHHVRSVVVLPPLLVAALVLPRPDLVVVLAVYAAVAVLLLLVAAHRARHLFSLRPAVPGRLLATTVAAGLAIFVLDASVFLVGRGDVWLAAAAFPALDATRYGTASMLGYQVTMLYGLAALAVMPVAARLLASRGEAAVRRMLSAAATLTVAATALVVAVLVVLGRPILEIAYGPGFGDAHPVLVILAIGGLGQALFGFSVPLLLVLGHLRRAVLACGVVLVVMAPVVVAAAFLGGPVALAAASATAAVLLPAAQWIAAGGRRGAPLPSWRTGAAVATLRGAAGS